MYTFSSLLCAPLLGAVAYAMVVPPQGSSALLARNAKIPVTIGFSDGTINWGTTNPVDVINMLYQNCYNSGVCDSKGYTAATQMPVEEEGQRWLDTATLTVAFGEAQFATWVKNGMVAALAEAVGQAMTSTVSTLNTSYPT
jgi:hypothetical protein